MEASHRTYEDAVNACAACIEVLLGRFPDAQAVVLIGLPELNQMVIVGGGFERQTEMTGFLMSAALAVDAEARKQ